ncbi:MAG: transglycosylase SLT domain-containing protein [Deltaproteobacteria bacterium]|nr:transglycosylase SLT domain-containing protein [Deltaproteobacteria bacterium]
MMRRKFFQIAGLLLILPLFGCAPSIDVSSDPANQISVTGIREENAANGTRAAELLSAGEIGTLFSSRPMMPAPGSLPFVRSQPKFVPPFPLVLNRTVQTYIDGYLAQPQGLRQSFQRSSPFMREMLSLFQDDGLPPDLVYLAFAESAFSADGAGPWQLSKTTAQRYGLTINQWLDERRDPIKSTRAAAEYLAELHDQTGADWRMTLVAWNNGDGGVARYMQLMTAPYERLMRRLPRRTCALMNRFMAVALIARHAKEYGVDEVSWMQAPRYRVIAVDGGTSLQAIAASNHISVVMLRRLNPALLSDRTPPGQQSYPIRVPDNSAEVKLFTTRS